MSGEHIEKDVIARIRSNPKLHFLTGIPNSADLISGLMNEGLREGCGECYAKIIDSFWCLYFDKDWISDFGEEKYFNSIIKYDIGRAGGIRYGIILKAFSSELHFYGRSNFDSLPQEFTKYIPILDTCECCVIFKDLLPLPGHPS
ncbi:MAG: hypothetical protein P8171_21080 [Candidatus Thiodiazotropha sp.]